MREGLEPEGCAVVRVNLAELIDLSQLEPLLECARQSPRRRAIHAFHRSAEDNPHRFLNVIFQGSYITPHRHARPPKAESFIVLHGELGVVLFSEDGEVQTLHRLRAPQGSAMKSGPPLACGIDLLPGVWHTIVALSATTIIFEVKPGPYVAETDKEFALWAPGEAETAAPAYMAWLEQQFQSA